MSYNRESLAGRARAFEGRFRSRAEILFDYPSAVITSAGKEPRERLDGVECQVVSSGAKFLMFVVICSDLNN